MENYIRAITQAASTMVIRTQSVEFPKIEVKTISDREALRGDWQRVGQDIQVAMDKFAATHL